MESSRAANILVVEDDPETAALLELYLKDAGYHVQLATRGEEGLCLARERAPDLILLDLMLPGMDGWTLCQELRRESLVPILMVTARTQEEDRLRGFELGVDDYISKPFSPREVMHRVRAVLKRTRPERSQRQEFGDLVLDSGRRTLRVNREEISLTTTEFEILSVLIGSPERVFSRGQLVAPLGLDFAGELRTVDAHIGNLRRKMKGSTTTSIQTVVGVGYTLKAHGE